MARIIPLLESVDADTDGAPSGWNGGEGTFVVDGDDFGGGTVTMELSPDGGDTWLPVADETTLTDNGVVGFRLAAGLTLRATLTGSSSPSGVSARIFVYGG